MKFYLWQSITIIVSVFQTSPIFALLVAAERRSNLPLLHPHRPATYKQVRERLEHMSSKFWTKGFILVKRDQTELCFL